MDRIEDYETDSDEFKADTPIEIDENKEPFTQMEVEEKLEFLDCDKIDEQARLAEEAAFKSNPVEIAKAMALLTMNWANEPIGDGHVQAKKQEALSSALAQPSQRKSLVGTISAAISNFRSISTEDQYATVIQEACLSMTEAPMDGQTPKRKSSDLLKLILASLLCGIFGHPDWNMKTPMPEWVALVSAITNVNFMNECIPFISNNKKVPTDTQLLIIFIAFAHRWFKPGDPTSLVAFALKNLFHQSSSSSVRFLSNTKRVLGLKAGCCDITCGSEWVHCLRWPDEMIDDRRASAAAAIRNKMTHVIDVEEELIGRTLNRWSLNAEKTGHYLAGWLAVQLAVGCRSSEVISPTVTFSLVEKGQTPDGQEDLYIVQTGQIKNKGVLPQDAAQPRVKPIMRIDLGWTAPAIIRMVNAIRAAVERDSNRKLVESTLLFFNNKYNSKLNRLLATAFPAQKTYCQTNGITFGTHFLRAVYAVYMWGIYKNSQKVPSQTKFIGDILGHDDPTYSPSKHYECIRIIPKADMAAKWSNGDELWNDELDDPKPTPKSKKSSTKKRDPSPVAPKAPKKEKKSVALPKLEEIKDLELSDTEEDARSGEESEPVAPKKNKKKRPAPDSDSDETTKPPKKKPSDQPPKVGAVRELSKGCIALCVRKANNPEGATPWFTHQKFEGKHGDDKAKMMFAGELMVKLGEAGIFPTSKILAKFSCNYKTLKEHHKERLLAFYNKNCPKAAVIDEDVEKF
jgi:hypothetical protein